MFDIGGSLAAARRARGLELPEVEALTCIRAKHLEALEAEQWDALPGRAYARTFLRTYATALGLDPAHYSNAFDERFPAVDDEISLPPPRRRRPFPTRLALAVVAVAAFLAVGLWPRSPAEPGEVAVKPAEASAAPRAHLVTRKPAARPRSTAAPGPLVISATRGDCWLLVRRGGEYGPELYERTLRAGEIVRFAAPRVWIRFGAPWNVDVRRGTRAIRALPTHPDNLVL